MTDDWHKAIQSQRAGRPGLLTEKQREDLEKPYVDAPDALAEQKIKPRADNVKRAARAREVKHSTDEAKQKFRDETIDKLAAEVRGRNSHLSNKSLAQNILLRVNERLVEAKYKPTSTKQIRKRLGETRQRI
jgi:hypothetical protein